MGAMKERMIGIRRSYGWDDGKNLNIGDVGGDEEGASDGEDDGPCFRRFGVLVKEQV